MKETNVVDSKLAVIEIVGLKSLQQKMENGIFNNKATLQNVHWRIRREKKVLILHLH